MSRRLTFSKLELAEKCLFAFRNDVEWDPWVPSQPALCGTAFGEYAYAVIRGQPVPEPLGLDEEHVEKLGHFKLNWTQGEYTHAEIAIAFNVVTGEVRYLGENIGREYDKFGAGPDDVCGSIDACAEDIGSIRVAEWKTGAQRKLNRLDNRQARGYAAAYARLKGVSQAEVEVQVIDDDGSKVYPDLLMGDEIADELARIASKAEEIELLNPQPVPGFHCKECPARGGCPAIRENTDALVKHRLPMLTTHEDVAGVVEKLVALEAQAEAIWDAVKVRVEEIGEVKLSDGRVYGMCSRTNESIKADAAEPILAAMGLKAATKVSLTKASVGDAVKAVAPKGKAAGMMRDVLAQLRGADALKESTSTYIGFRKG